MKSKPPPIMQLRRLWVDAIIDPLETQEIYFRRYTCGQSQP